MQTMELRVVFIMAILGIVRSKLINSCKETKSFVKGHNSFRLQLAKGEVDGQPAASKMNYVVWDDELATKAANWASKNKYGHNPDRTVPSGRFSTGENIYFYGTSDMNYKFDPQQAMDSWWSEYKDFSHGQLSASHFQSPKQIGHYTQMAWANTLRIGCGISQYIKDDWNNFFVVCNYGPTGNYLGESPYDTSDEASSRLVCGESDCNKLYGDKC